MFKNYFKTAFRNLSRNRVYSFINVVGLSLGLACAMLIILYVKDEVSYDRFQKNMQVYRVVRELVNNDGSRLAGDGYTGYPQGPQFTAGIPEIKGFIRLQNGFMDIKNGPDIQSQQVLSVDSNFFSVFTFPLLSGNPATALLQPNAVVISEDMAKKQFGTTDATGKTILVKNNDAFEPHLITGVAKRCPQNSSVKFDIVMPLKVSAVDENDKDAWLNVFLNTFVVLNANTDVKAVEAKMKRVFEANAGEAIRIAKEKYDIKWSPSFLLQPFTDMHLSKEYPPIDGLTDASDPTFSYILAGIALFILLIACINFVNLTVARSLKRAKEIGIRKVIGGSRKQLIIQFLGESFILCFIAFVLALVLVQILLPLFNQLSNKALALSYLLDAKLMAGYTGLFIITGLLAGFYPALVLSGYNPVQTLYSRLRLSGKNYLQQSLVVLQFALASFLIIATLTIFSQFNYLTHKELGYDDSNLIVINQPGLNADAATIFSHELMAKAGIVGVAPKNSGYYNTAVKISEENKVGIVIETVNESYIPLLKIPFVKGRNFSKDFPSDSGSSVLVNETFVNKAGWKEPIGQQISIGFDDPKKYTIVGVVKDHYYQPLNEVIKSQVFSLKLGRGYGSLYIRIKPGSEAASLQAIEKTYKKVFPLSPYSYYFKSQENRRSYEMEAKWKQIMLFGAIITIFISCIGLFGLSVLSAEKRTKEIGIRKVLGASVSSIATILSKDFLKLVIVALLTSIPLAWIVADKWLQNYPYRIKLSWPMFAIAGLLVVLIAMATVSFQAVKAAVANPVKSLRTE